LIRAERSRLAKLVLPELKIAVNVI
jgi:hypothetical protein